MDALVDSAHAPAPGGYRHEAVVYSGDDGYVNALVPFVREGVANGEHVLIAVPGEHKLGLLREALGHDRDAVDHVRFMDMADLGRNPAHIIPAWLDFVAAHAGRPVRGIGEPIWAGRRPDELAECQLPEALLNVVVDPSTPFELWCPYDALALGPDVLAEAQRSHDHRGAVDHLHSLFTDELPSAPDHALALPFGVGDLRPVRDAVRDRALATEVGFDRVDDLILAVHEIATNSVIHGGGHGTVRIWTSPDAFVVEIADAGRITDPVVGRLPPDLARLGGRGLWLAHRMCDLVQVRSNAGGTTVRISTWR